MRSHGFQLKEGRFRLDKKNRVRLPDHFRTNLKLALLLRALFKLRLERRQAWGFSHHSSDLPHFSHLSSSWIQLVCPNTGSTSEAQSLYINGFCEFVSPVISTTEAQSYQHWPLGMATTTLPSSDCCLIFHHLLLIISKVLFPYERLLRSAPPAQTLPPCRGHRLQAVVLPQQPASSWGH